MKDIPVRRGRRYIASLVENGEHAGQDFKYAISDARKIARSISAFANADGGQLLIGVKDNGSIAGVRNEEDIYVVEQAAERYCDPPQYIDFEAYSVDTGVVVILARIAAADSRPVYCIDADGRHRAYFRVADENIEAHPLMVEVWRNHDALSFRLDSAASRLLDLIDVNSDGLAIDTLHLSLGMSQRATNQLIIDMAGAGVIAFTHSRDGFRLIRNRL